MATPEAAVRRREREWAYGVTTVPERRADLLPSTLASLARAGFDRPRLFVDQCTLAEGVGYESQYRLDVTARGVPGLKTFGNWILGIWELWVRQPRATRYAMFQDDLVASAGLRDYLDGCGYPDDGYLNLYTSPSNQQMAPRNSNGGTVEGWFPSNQLGKGAVGLVFDRDTLLALLSSEEHICNRPISVDRSTRCIDGGVVDALRKKGRREYCHSPSLLQHTGVHTTMGSKPQPSSVSFRGEGYDVSKLLGSAVPPGVVRSGALVR